MDLSLVLHNLAVEYGLKICTAAVAIYILFRFLSVRIGKKYPPGPIGLPVVGYLPFLTENPQKKFEELRKKYGNVFSMYLGSQYVVVIGDVDTLRATYNLDEYNGRAAESVFSPGIFRTTLMSINDTDWAVNRKMVFHMLKGMGKGNDYVEGIVQEEMFHFLREVTQSNGSPLDIKGKLETCVSNNVTQLVFGKRFEYDDETRIFINKCIQKNVERASQTAWENFMHSFKNIPLVQKWSGLDVYYKLLEELWKFYEQEFEEHKRTLDPNNVRDFIDCALLQDEKCKKDGIPSSFTKEMIMGDVQVLLGAGTETVSTSMQWIFYTMVAQPEIQQRVQKEIDDVIGRERTPRFADQKEMPYATSVIMEVQRYFTIVALNANRYTMADTKAGVYDVPKNTVIISNLGAILHDPKHWDEPDKFKPERFLDKDKKIVLKPKSYLPFSFGKRICPGEALSNMEMFLFLTGTLQKFTIRLPKGEVLNMDPQIFITTQPRRQNLCFEPR